MVSTLHRMPIRHRWDHRYFPSNLFHPTERNVPSSPNIGVRDQLHMGGGGGAVVFPPNTLSGASDLINSCTFYTRSKPLRRTKKRFARKWSDFARISRLVFCPNKNSASWKIPGGCSPPPPPLPRTPMSPTSFWLERCHHCAKVLIKSRRKLTGSRIKRPGK